MRVSELIKDKNTLINVIIAVVLTGLHSWQFIKSDFEIRALVNLIMAVVFVITSLILGARSLSYYLVTYAFVWLPFEEFDSLTSLLLFFSAVSLNKKLWVCFLPYCIGVFMTYMFNDLEISHIGITACYIFFFWNVYKSIREKHSAIKPLVLTDEEEMILKELCDGKEVKELNMSEKTAYNKLREARQRNNCLTNKELKEQYKSTVKTVNSNLQ